MGALADLRALLITGRCAEMMSSGSIELSQTLILVNSTQATPRFTSSYPVSLNWSTTDMGLVLNILIKERPDLAPSSDPIYTIQASLMECQDLEAALETPFLLPCINMTFCSRVTSPTSVLVVRLWDKADVSDRLYLIVNP